MTPTERSVPHEIVAYAEAQPQEFREMCEMLCKLITSEIPNAEARVWHGSPVWLIDGNPVVGYSANASAVKLLFWNGVAMNEPALQPVGKYGAAQAVFGNSAEIDGAAVRRWLSWASENVFDSNAFFKQRRAKR